MIARRPEPGDIRRAAPGRESAALGVLSASDQRRDKIRDLARSIEPAASIMTMTAPVAAAKPHASAFPLPRRFCWTMRTSGHRDRPVRIVSSVERPSTRMISATPAGIRVASHGRFRASLSAGLTTDTAGPPGSRSIYGAGTRTCRHPPGCPIALAGLACSAPWWATSSRMPVALVPSPSGFVTSAGRLGPWGIVLLGSWLERANFLRGDVSMRVSRCFISVLLWLCLKIPPVCRRRMGRGMGGQHRAGWWRFGSVHGASGRPVARFPSGPGSQHVPQTGEGDPLTMGIRATGPSSPRRGNWVVGFDACQFAGVRGA